VNRAFRWLVIPIGFAVLAVGVMLLVDLSRPDPVMATVVDMDLIGMNGRTAADVECMTDGGTPRSEYLVIPEQYRGNDVVPLIVHEDGTVAIDDGDFEPWLYVAVGIIAFGLGLTMEQSLRGFGYVRGTGRVGETPDLDVGESHGFYSRT
jgi:hypothetical protein